MSEPAKEKKVLEHKDVQVFIELGLPGCYALEMIPGSRPGMLRRADPDHKVLAAMVLKLYRAVERLSLQAEEPTVH